LTKNFPFTQCSNLVQKHLKSFKNMGVSQHFEAGYFQWRLKFLRLSFSYKMISYKITCIHVFTVQLFPN